MKKLTALLLMLVLTASLLIGCGGEEADSAEVEAVVSEETPEAVQAEEPAEEAPAEEVTAEETAAVTVEEYFATEEGQIAYDAIVASGNVQEGLSLELRLDGNTMYYDFIIEDGYFEGTDIDDVISMLASGTEAEAATYINSALQIVQGSGAEKCDVVISYIYEGETLTEAAFSSEDEMPVDASAVAFEGTLEEFFATPEGEAAFNSIKESLTAGEQDGFTMEVAVEDNTVFYIVTFDDGIFEGVDTAALTSLIDDLMTAQEATLTSSLESLNTFVVNECAFDVQFIYEGEVLSQKTITAQ